MSRNRLRLAAPLRAEQLRIGSWSGLSWWPAPARKVWDSRPPERPHVRTGLVAPRDHCELDIDETDESMLREVLFSIRFRLSCPRESEVSQRDHRENTSA
jgi:hypothetical protein